MFVDGAKAAQGNASYYRFRQPLTLAIWYLGGNKFNRYTFTKTPVLIAESGIQLF
jgi:hypothetical protein